MPSMPPVQLTCAAACATHGTKFIHVSTDYVFNGSSSQPYKETDPTDPVNVYGASKLKGEELGLQQNPDTIIIRTAWVYSAFGNNFVKTMLRLMKERASLNVVNDQIGAPTYAADLAGAILHIINKGTGSRAFIITATRDGSAGMILQWPSPSTAAAHAKCIPFLLRNIPRRLSGLLFLCWIRKRSGRPFSCRSLSGRRACNVVFYN